MIPKQTMGEKVYIEQAIDKGWLTRWKDLSQDSKDRWEYIAGNHGNALPDNPYGKMSREEAEALLGPSIQTHSDATADKSKADEMFRKLDRAYWMEHVIRDIRAERARQEEKWGEQNHDFPTWNVILMEEVGKHRKPT